MNWIRSAIVVGICASLVSCSRDSGPKPLTGDRKFTLVHSESNLGNIEPCSCNNRTVGGFPRRATLLKELRRDNAAVLVLDAGNSLVSEHIDSAPLARQAKAKAEAIAQAFVRTGLDAMVFGDLELKLGSQYFLDLVKATNLPVIAANARDRKTGDTLFPPYKIVDFDGLRVAVLGLVAQELHPLISDMNEKGSRQVKANSKKLVNMEELFEDRQVKIDDPIEAAATWVPRLRQQAHFVVVLAHLPQKVQQDLTAKVEGIDCVVGTHAPIAQRATYTVQGSTLVLTSPINGTNIGVVDFQVKNGDLLFSDRTPLERARELIPTQRKFLEDIVKQFGTDDVDVVRSRSPELATRLEKLKLYLAEQEGLITTSAGDTSSYFIQRSVSLDGRAHADDPEMHEFVRGYRRGLTRVYAGQAFKPSLSIQRKPNEPFYVKAEACVGCHVAQAEFWRNTPHGHAWDTMIREEATQDVECIGCHTVAWLGPNGFDRPDQVAGHENVQCENCHGPGSAHARGSGFIDPGTIIGIADEMKCEDCHNSQHSPGFRRDTYVPRASCPPIDPNEAVIRGVYGRVAGELTERIGTDSSKPQPYVALLDVYNRLGQPERAIEVAERGLSLFPEALRLRVGKARALDAAGRSEEALELLAELQDEETAANAAPAAGGTQPVTPPTGDAGKVRKRPGDAKLMLILRESIEILLHARAVESRNAEAALELADWCIEEFGAREPAYFRQKAEALRVLGRIDDAIAVLQGAQETRDRLAHQFEQMLGDLRAEREGMLDYLAPPPMASPPTPN
ncbi:MAG: tetratricopeptide repeat protein [Planctomycetes bacterium]|nr:tetratricopeptide repeat protein [Planctomycetota bacterium]MCC7169850.1 tetratricopeptide repeat protein [Planctomycetota bacterium]